MTLTHDQIANRQRFTRALRSGKYLQTRSEYVGFDFDQQRHTFCVMGLAWELQTVHDRLENIEWTVLDYYGLSLSQQCELTDLNDDGLANFADLAEVIDRMTTQEEENRI